MGLRDACVRVCACEAAVSNVCSQANHVCVVCVCENACVHMCSLCKIMCV